MTLRSGKSYNSQLNTINNFFTNIHLLYYASLYEKLFNNVSRQTLAIYNIDNYNNDNDRFKQLSLLEKFIKNNKISPV